MRAVAPPIDDLSTVTAAARAEFVADRSPGSPYHLTLLMAPHGLNLVVGDDRKALLAYGSDVWRAAHAAETGGAAPPDGFVEWIESQTEPINWGSAERAWREAENRYRVRRFTDVFEGDLPEPIV